MSKDAKAIPDMSDLLAAVKLFLEEEVAAETADPATRVDIFPLQLEKAITTLSGAQTTLFRKAKRLLSAAGDRTEEEIDELLAAMPKVIIVVDTADCEERPQRLALFLAGMLLSKALGRETMVVDGQSVDLSEAMVDSWDALCPAMPSSTTGAIRRLEASFEVARQHMQEEGAKKYDVLFLCRRFAAGEEDNDAVVQLLERFQKAAEPRLRTLRLHRIRHRAEMVGTECISFMPRPRATPLNPTLASADLLFMVDFTGSMGAYIEAVKTELVSLIQELRASTRLQHVRVGLVGYRDYRKFHFLFEIGFFV